jgi:hypothetical protein
MTKRRTAGKKRGLRRKAFVLTKMLLRDGNRRVGEA